jgi:hypothetical protein
MFHPSGILAGYEIHTSKQQTTAFLKFIMHSDPPLLATLNGSRLWWQAYVNMEVFLQVSLDFSRLFPQFNAVYAQPSVHPLGSCRSRSRLSPRWHSWSPVWPRSKSQVWSPGPCMWSLRSFGFRRFEHLIHQDRACFDFGDDHVFITMEQHF